MSKFWKGTIMGFIVLILSYSALVVLTNTNCVLSAVISFIAANVVQINIIQGRND
jgi:hypothetical protein